MTTRNPSADKPPRLAAVLALALILGGPGCTTTRSLYPPAAAPENALAGVTVKVLTNEGERVKLKVAESSAETLSGTDSSGLTRVFRLQDIRSLQLTRVSAGKTALLVGGVVVATAGLALAIGDIAVFPPPP